MAYTSLSRQPIATPCRSGQRELAGRDYLGLNGPTVVQRGSPSEMSRVAFVGIGTMGYPMARNLVAAGHEIRAFDLSPEALARTGTARASSTAAPSTG